MPHASPPDLLVLHAVRRKGTVRAPAVAERYGLDPALVEEPLLDRQATGRVTWADAGDRDSCHAVWFELHEDLLSTLGIERGAEAAGSA